MKAKGGFGLVGLGCALSTPRFVEAHWPGDAMTTGLDTYDTPFSETR
jgi:hypothetical protein